MTKSRSEEVALFSVVTPLPRPGASPPEWITIFPNLGDVNTRDGRSFIVDGPALVAEFEREGIDIPVDVNHSTDTAAAHGNPSPAVGWISRLKVERGALRGKVDWLAEGAELLARRAYRYVSPSFYHSPEKRTTRLKAVALVTAPALANQPALAAAQSRNCAALGARPEEMVFGVVATPVAQAARLPDWVVVFPALGFVETQAEEVFYIDGKAIVDNFVRATRGRSEDYREFPVYVDHRAEQAIERGEDAVDPPIGYIADLRIAAGRLEAMIDWTVDAAAVVIKKGIASVSPAFFVEQGGKAKRLKSISMVRYTRPFLKSRAVGNDVAREERKYIAPPVDENGDVRDQIAAVARRRPLSDAELSCYTAIRIKRELEEAGLSADYGKISTQASSLVASDPEYALQKILEGSAPRSDAANLSTKSQPPGATKPAMTNDEAIREGRLLADSAKQLMLRASGEGRTLSYLDAVAQADAQNRLSVMPDAGATRPAMTNDEAIREGRLLAERAKQLMLRAAGEGRTLSYLDAVAQADAQNRLSVMPDAGAAGGHSNLYSTAATLISEGLACNYIISQDDALRMARAMSDSAVRGAGFDVNQEGIMLSVKAKELVRQSGFSLSFEDALQHACDALGLSAHARAAERKATAPFRSKDAPKVTPSAQSIIREAETLMATAAKAGRPMDMFSAISKVARDWGLSTDPEGYVSNDAGTSHASAIANRDARPNVTTITDALLREAEAIMATANAAGRPIDLITAIQDIVLERDLSTAPGDGSNIETGLGAASPNAGSRRKSKNDVRPRDLIREAEKLMATAASAGRPITFTKAMEKVTKNLGLN